MSTKDVTLEQRTAFEQTENTLMTDAKAQGTVASIMCAHGVALYARCAECEDAGYVVHTSVAAQGNPVAKLEAEIARLTKERDTANELRNQYASENQRLFGKKLARDAEIARLTSLLAAAEADARRYRWLRERVFKDGGALAIEIPDAYDKHTGGNLNEGLDAAIDAAIDAQGVKP